MSKPFEYTELKNWLEGELKAAEKNLKLALGEGKANPILHHQTEVAVLKRVTTYVTDMEQRYYPPKELAPK